MLAVVCPRSTDCRRNHLRVPTAFLVPVPQIVEEIMEVIQLTFFESFLLRTVEQIVDVPVRAGCREVALQL